MNQNHPGSSLLRKREETYDYELVVVSPLRVLERLRISPNAVNLEELDRTTWLWTQRPRHYFMDRRKAQGVFLAVTTILSWRGPLYATASGILGLVLLVVEFLSTRRQRRWCENYNAAITRLAAASPGNRNPL